MFYFIHLQKNKYLDYFILIISVESKIKNTVNKCFQLSLPEGQASSLNDSLSGVTFLKPLLLKLPAFL